MCYTTSGYIAGSVEKVPRCHPIYLESREGDQGPPGGSAAGQLCMCYTFHVRDLAGCPG